MKAESEGQPNHKDQGRISGQKNWGMFFPAVAKKYVKYCS